MPYDEDKLISPTYEQEPEKQCLFCVDREKQRYWAFTPLTDKFVMEHLAKEGITQCNHNKINETSIWFADFIAESLLSYIFDNHLEKQRDEEFKDKTLRNAAIMIPAMKKEMNDKLVEFPLEHFGESDRPLMKAKQDKMPKWIEIAKEMYQVKGLER